MSQEVDFTQDQLAQLVDYLRFEEQKRKEMRTEISGEIEDVFEEKLEKDVIYSGKDGLEQLACLSEQIDKTVKSELERSRDINIVLINHIFRQAQSAGISLEISVPDLVNKKVTDEANRLCGRILANGTKMKTKASPKKKAPSPAPSPSPSPAKKVEEDAEAKKKREDEEVAALRAENERLKKQLQMNKREWPEFKDAVQKLKDRNTEIHKLREKLGESV